MSTVAISTPSAPASARRSALWKSLFVQVLAALLLGILLGVATPGPLQPIHAGWRVDELRQRPR